MSILSQVRHPELVNSVAERYQREGYEVLRGLGPGAVPFDLGGYCPDLIVRKGDVRAIVTVRAQAQRLSFDQLRAVAEEVRRHPGWRFVLVTGEDVAGANLPAEERARFPGRRSGAGLRTRSDWRIRASWRPGIWFCGSLLSG